MLFRSESLWRNTLNQNTKTIKRDNIQTTGVHYSALQQSQTFQAMKRAIQHIDISQLKTRNEQIAFWINMYNIAAVNLVLDYYPIKNLDRIATKQQFYTKHALVIAGKPYSLNQIRDILHPFQDKTLLFTLSTGALSSPRLLREPYTASRLPSQIDSNLRHFFQEKYLGARLEKGVQYLYISALFKDHPTLFQSDTQIKSFISLFLHGDTTRYQVFFLPFNRSLNDY